MSRKVTMHMADQSDSSSTKRSLLRFFGSLSMVVILLTSAAVLASSTSAAPFAFVESVKEYFGIQRVAEVTISGNTGLSSSNETHFVQPSLAMASLWAVAPASQDADAGQTQNYTFEFFALNNTSNLNQSITIPAGWTTPTLTPGPGEVTVTSGTCVVTSFSITGNTINLSQTVNCTSGQNYFVNYLNATAPITTGPYEFTSGPSVGIQPVVTVVNTATTTTVTTSGSPSTYGSMVTFTATVAPNPGAGNGNVTFNAAAGGCVAVPVNASGQATCQNNALTVPGSPHTVTANYNGGTGYLSSGGSLTGGQSVSAIALTATVTASNKPYDGNNTASITACALSGVIGLDDVTCNFGGYSATFNNEDVGTGKPVAATGLLLAGADAGNYSFGGTGSGSANITPLNLTATVTASNKIYNGNDSATINTCGLTGVIGLDDVTCSGVGTFTTGKNVGNGKAVSAVVTLAGGDSGNYTVTSPAFTTADITQLGVTGTYSAANKAYDGNAVAALSAPTVVTPIGLDDVTLTSGVGAFNNPNVGTNKPVTVTGASLTGVDAPNYLLGAVSANNAEAANR